VKAFDEQRLDLAFERALARPIEGKETESLLRFLAHNASIAKAARTTTPS